MWTNFNKKLRSLYFLLLISAFSVYILIHLTIKFSIFSVYNKNTIEIECQPIFSNHKQFSVNINGTIYPRFISLSQNKSLNFDCFNRNKKAKTILLWNNRIGAPLFEQSVGLRIPFEQMGCPVTNCELTTNRSQFAESSLVLFHLRSQVDYFP